MRWREALGRNCICIDGTTALVWMRGSRPLRVAFDPLTTHTVPTPALPHPVNNGGL